MALINCDSSRLGKAANILGQFKRQKLAWMLTLQALILENGQTQSNELLECVRRVCGVGA